MEIPLEYRALIDEMRVCTRCEFQNPQYPPLVPMYVQLPVTIMFVGENPSWAKDQEVPFSATTISGQALDQYYLNPLNLRRKEVWITDLFKCRYPKEVYHDKSNQERAIQTVVNTCAMLWLLDEIRLAKPKVIVTLSDKQVYKRFRQAFKLTIPGTFEKAVGIPHEISIAGFSTFLFPMIHPDISRPVGDGDGRKVATRKKWSPIHQDEYIPALERLLKSLE